MAKKLIICFCVILLICLLSGCMSKSQKEAIYNKAVPIATEYMKTHYNVEVIISDYYEINDPANSEIVLYGHIVEDADASFTVGINHKSYKINRVGVSSKLKDSKVMTNENPTP
ncbi:hypothetical protein KB559_16415 [Paenibacillus sp. Marseille-P2973]|uniref:hypothetical protein n=1 Tax=Paenibacillus sp. Marseille-P2973 TaxID=1871032 RepID=UPI001B399348|nr:hypothetical protein [Paenibacillus sp. Marseille-P2973]MBQ4900422.1 hypothetical protein [Paenibacillus sp. Marseille-P2973]